jgi:hypothetical protein
MGAVTFFPGDVVSGLDRRAGRAFAPGLSARLAARVRARRLDAALIAGADPADAAALAARASQLTSSAARAAIADALERWVEGSDRRRRWAVIPNGRAIEANRAELWDLVAALRAPRPVYARGVAMLQLLLSDGGGPAYADDDGFSLRTALCEARVAIGG